jgi:hypothetical protein
MNIHRAMLLISAFLLLSSASAPCGQLRIIELEHRTADEIIRIVKPLLGPGDTISGKKFTIVLTAAPEHLSRIESVIQTLDRPSRQLLIIVVQGKNAKEALASIDVSGHVSIGEHARVEFGRQPQREGTVSVTGRRDGSVQSDVDIQRLRVQEGLPAFITIGQSIPVSTRDIAPRSSGSGVVYRELRTGFRVVPRLTGDRFVLDIASQRNANSPSGYGTVETQQIQTQVQGKLNQWIEIGGVLGVRQQHTSGFVYSDEQRKQSRTQVFLTVVEAAD